MKLVRSSWFLAGFAVITIALITGVGLVASFTTTHDRDTASELDGELTTLDHAPSLAAVGGDVPREVIALKEWYDGVARAEWYRGVEEELARQARDAEARALARRVGTGGGGGSCNGDVACFLECTRAHESDTSGGYSAVNPNGYYGAYQFAQATWDAAVSGAGWAEYAGMRPDQAPAWVQDAAAAHLYGVSGNRPWEGRC